MFDQVRSWLFRTVMVSFGLVAAGWAAHRLGVLPAGWAALLKPLVVLTAASVSISDAMGLTRQMLRTQRLRWSKRVAITGGVAFVAIRIGIMLYAGLENILPPTAVLLLIPVAGAALLVDAWEGWRFRSLPRLGVWGAASVGAGLLLLMGSGLGGAWMLHMVIAGLIAVLGGGLAGSFSLRQIERAEAIALASPSVALDGLTSIASRVHR
ncbi:hypothetical protein [Longimicrobium terrae]|uniref:Uncharacterized protein n=1 Tax=Longimicrobium terrae TaxID=1639882 RepID=A0A841GXA4_9BACT|nr:hypothetical protein [Longimicrobium terrae]MBB4635333.1 hypothetical protein [Longimicrobium terrae]MBB6069726.1 hypothetical protein [Longimicrobium terrae]NNC31063.1 hypothetical protein [Longimicrobium terrae]